LRPSNGVFALVERATVSDQPAGHSMDSNLQPVDFVRYYSVLIRKPLSCVMGHDIARYSGGSVLDLFSHRQMRNFINYRPLGR
jgi:hypothetical protein